MQRTYDKNYDYTPYGKILWQDNNKDERHSFLGKEKDEESDLGDYGVRKYDDLTGRFTATDPLWEKYYGWSPYVYSGNDPVNKVDLDGKDIIVLLDKEGANDMGVAMGHSAVLIGNDDSGWNLFSKNKATYGIFGASVKYDDYKYFNNLSEFNLKINENSIETNLPKCENINHDKLQKLNLNNELIEFTIN